LLQGSAEATEDADRVAIARDVIFSRNIVDQIILSNDLAAGAITPADMERVRLKLYKDTKVSDIPPSTFVVSYKSEDPVLSYNVTKQFGDLFLERSILEQTRESNDAFNFISERVDEYREKLAASEERLRDFRAKVGFDIVANAGNIDQEMILLRRTIEKNELDLAEARAQESSLKRQLTGESASAVKNFRSNQIQEQIGALQNDIDRLRLDYTDTYPDIIRMKQKIESLRAQADRERNSQSSGTGQLDAERTSVNRVYQDIKGQLAKASVAVETLRVRLNQNRARLRKETDRATSSNNYGAQLTELKRDYDVNQELYQDMLRRLEQARVSMNLDEQKQGLSFRIQEPAVVPTLPKGLRFLHFLASGLVLGALIPLGLLFTYLTVEPKLRTQSEMEEQLGLPVLATIPHYRREGEHGGALRSKFVLMMVLLGVIAAYVVSGFLRLTAGSV